MIRIPAEPGTSSARDEKGQCANALSSSIARLDKGFDMATAGGWTIVDIMGDGKTIFMPALRGDPDAPSVTWLALASPRGKTTQGEVP